jgi:hypothetical protein
MFKYSRRSFIYSFSFKRRVSLDTFPTIDKNCICGLFVCVPSHCPYLYANEWNQIDSEFVNLAPYQGSSLETIDDLLNIIKEETIENNDGNISLVDFGAGDGRILIRAIQRNIANEAYGWELNQESYLLGLAHIQATLSSVQLKRCFLNYGDASSININDHNVITLFLLPSGLKSLESLFLEKFQYHSTVSNAFIKDNNLSKTIILSLGWPFSSFNEERMIITKSGNKIYLYNFYSSCLL